MGRGIRTVGCGGPRSEAGTSGSFCSPKSCEPRNASKNGANCCVMVHGSSISELSCLHNLHMCKFPHDLLSCG